jgi:protocatechuate 3,4-dioxygenase alpha subunit
MSLPQTPSQTVGPYFAYGLVPTQYGYAFPSLWGPDLAEPSTVGEHITISGRVFDGQGQPVLDALLEIQQADAQGQLPETSAQVLRTGFRGFGRMGTGSRPDHSFVFRTVRPGATQDGQAPHIDVILTLRGVLNHLFTRIYFEDDAAVHATDPLLQAIPEARRPTLMARRDAAGVYRFDIHLQGPHETVFLDV